MFINLNDFNDFKTICNNENIEYTYSLVSEKIIHASSSYVTMEHITLEMNKKQSNWTKLKLDLEKAFSLVQRLSSETTKINVLLLSLDW